MDMLGIVGLFVSGLSLIVDYLRHREQKRENQENKHQHKIISLAMQNSGLADFRTDNFGNPIGLHLRLTGVPSLSRLISTPGKLNQSKDKRRTRNTIPVKGI